MGSTLRLKIAIALLPQDQVELELNAQAHLDWLHLSVDELRQEPRRSIVTVNF